HLAVSVPGSTNEPPPATARAVVAGIDPELLPLLRALAVLPPEAGLAEVALLLDRPVGTVAATVDRATEAGLLIDGPVFAAELVRRAVLGALDPATVAALRAEAVRLLVEEAPVRRAARWLVPLLG